MKTSYLSVFVTTILIHSVLLVSCLNSKMGSTKHIEWTKIYNTAGDVDFCHIDYDSAQHKQYLISYSHPFTAGGGLDIVRICVKNYGITFDTLFAHQKNVLSFVNVQTDIIGFIEIGFENNTLSTTLFFSFNDGVNWTKKETPLSSIRKFYAFKSSLVAEGNLNGTGQVFKSNDLGKHWENVAFSPRYKSFFLTGSRISDTEIFCIGSTEFNDRKNKLLLFNIKNGLVNELLDIKTVNSFVQPISKDKNIYLITNGNRAKLYSYKAGKMTLAHEFSLPPKTTEVRNFFMLDTLYMLTGETSDGKTFSWISFQRGETWNKYHEKQGFKLIFNSDGELFMSDKSNNILHGAIVDSLSSLHQ